MTTRAPSLVLLLTAVLVCGWPAAASAQPESLDRPFRGLFGSAGNDANQTQQMVLTISGFGSYDDDVLGDARRRPTPGAQQGGYFTGGSGQLFYGYSKDAFSIASDVSMSTRYHPEEQDLSALTVAGGIGLQTALGTRTTMQLNARGFKSPRYQLGLLSETADAEIAIDAYGDAYALGRFDSVGGSGNATITRQLTTRTFIDASYGYTYVEYSQLGSDSGRQFASGVIRHRVTSYSTVRLGYRRKTYGADLTGQTIEEDGLIAGVDYSRPWSLSGRRTMLTVHPGWSLIRDGDRTRARATGSAMLTHQIGRSWTASTQYLRGVRFIDGLDMFAFSDQVSGGINGLLGPRLDAVVSAAYSSGQYGRMDGGFETYTGRVQMRYALTRILALYGQYFYYIYEFDRPEQLPDWFTSRMERQGVRVGLTMQFPLIR